jgi:hypothetical protein
VLIEKGKIPGTPENIQGNRMNHVQNVKLVATQPHPQVWEKVYNIPEADFIDINV